MVSRLKDIRLLHSHLKFVEANFSKVCTFSFAPVFFVIVSKFLLSITSDLIKGTFNTYHIKGDIKDLRIITRISFEGLESVGRMYKLSSGKSPSFLVFSLVPVQIRGILSLL